MPLAEKRDEPKMTRLAPASSRARASSADFEASADLAGEARAEHIDEVAVVALAHGGVEVDELDEGVPGEAGDPGLEVVEGELELFALDELDDLAAEEVDGGDEHL